MMMQINRGVISIGNTCNLRCRHCYDINNLPNQTNVSNLDIEVLDWFQRLGIKNVGISGGEPFITRGLMYQYLDKCQQFGFKTNIASNGTLITEDDIKKLKQYENVTIQISLDGTKKYHEYIRGIGTYESTISVVKKLISASIGTNVIMTINKKNYMCLESFCAEISDLGLNQIFFERYVPSNRIDELALDLKTVEEAYEILYKIESEMSLKIHINDPMYLAFKLSKLESDLRDLTIGFINESNACVGCSLCKTSIYVKSNGDVFPCVFWDQSLGNYQHLTPQDLQSRFSSMLYELEGSDSKCLKCLYKDVCGGCKAISKKYGGDWKGDNDLCFIYSEIT